MNIALCISGQPRFFEKGYEYIKKYIIEPNNISDIFLHFWFDENEIGNYGYKNTSKTLTTDGYFGDLIKSNTVNKILDIYNPIKFAYEKQYDCNEFIKRDYSSRSNLTNPFATFSQYLSTHKCINLKSEYEKEKDFKYDVLIKCRYDFISDTKIIVDNFSIKDQIIFHNDVHSPTIFAFNDGIFFGDNKLMERILSEAYFNFDNYWCNNKMIDWDNHQLLGEYFRLNLIKFEKHNLGKIRWIRK